MAITAARHFEGPRSASEDDKGVATAVETWHVLTDSATDSAWDIDAANVVPRKFDPHPEDASLLVRKRSFTQSSEKATFWIATIEYSTETNDQQQSDDNPLQRPVKKSWAPNSIQKPLFRDTAGAAVLNTAGIPYNPPHEVQVRQTTLRYVRNEETFNDTVARSYDGRVNLTTFKGYAAGKMLCSISAENDFYRGVEYWIITYEFEYNVDGWQPTLLSQGLLHKQGGVIKRVKDNNGEDVTEPIPLDSNGLAITTPGAGAAALTQHTGYLTAEFNNLNLPG